MEEREEGEGEWTRWERASELLCALGAEHVGGAYTHRRSVAAATLLL